VVIGAVGHRRRARARARCGRPLRAKQAGARILTPPEDKPYGRSYRVEDLEGHRWMFQTPAKG